MKLSLKIMKVAINQIRMLKNKIVHTRGFQTQMVDGKRIYVYLDAETRVKAALLGDGNISKGIRLAFKEIK